MMDLRSGCDMLTPMLCCVLEIAGIEKMSPTFVGALRAFEQARPKPRKTVLKALEKRTQEAAAMMAEEAQQR